MNKGVRGKEEAIAGRKGDTHSCPQTKNEGKMFSRKLVQEEACWKHQ